MGISDQDHEMVRQLVTGTILNNSFRRATFSGATRGARTSPWLRVVLRPLEIRGERHLQFSYFDSHKDITKNYLRKEAQTQVDELIDIVYSGIHLSTDSEEIDIQTTKKGKVLIGRKKLDVSSLDHSSRGEAHNRIKELPLPEGRSNRLLEAMGILTSDGRVRPTMRAKYTQINEFLKHLIHVLEQTGLRSLGREIEILDCGCGSSYLTLAVHHYLNEILAIPARITGIDVNEDVIRKSVAKAERLSMDKLAFACGRIREIKEHPDIVLALHACDTATDDAIAQAIRSEAKLLLSVPCCHKNLNKAIRPNETAEVLRPMLRHGILHQRTADIVTDAFRALALRIMGYQTEVVEFVSDEHTARNLMIRAVRGASIGDTKEVEEYVAMRRFWNVTPYIEKLLGEPFQKLLTQ